MRYGRLLPAIALALGAAAVPAAPAYAAPVAETAVASVARPGAITELRTVGPFYTWGACDSERRVYSSRYGYKTYPCELHSNGLYYFQYEG